MKIGKPLPWSPEDRIFIPELAPLFGGNPDIPASLLGKNCLVTGETGSGKSLSFAIPMLKGLTRHRADDPDHRFALLVVDPKRELLEIVRAELGDSERLVVLGEEGSPMIDFHEGMREELSVIEAFDQALEALSPGVKKSAKSGGDNMYWTSSSLQLARQLVDLVASVEATGKTIGDLLARYEMWQDPSENQVQFTSVPARTFASMALIVEGYFRPQEGSMDVFKSRIALGLSAIQRLVTSESCSGKGVGAGVSIPAGRRDALRLVRLIRRMASSFNWPNDMTEEYLRTWLRQVESGTDEIVQALWNKYVKPNPFAQPVGHKLLLDSYFSTYDPATSSWYAQPAGILTALLASLRIGREKRFDAPSSECIAIGDVLRRIARHVGRPDLAEALGNLGAADVRSQYWNADICLTFFKPLMDRDVASRLHLNPVKDSDRTISIQQSVEDGCVVVFQPKMMASDADDAFAKTLKQHFFRATLSREHRTRGAGVIVDEAHRFVGVEEASWVDVCRAYRGITCLATQSVASLRLALAKQDSDLSPSGIDAAVQVLVTNLSNKFFFRSSDIATRDLLRSLIPVSPGMGPHVIDVRGPVTLHVGECWALTGDGGYARRAIKLTSTKESPSKTEKSDGLALP